MKPQISNATYMLAMGLPLIMFAGFSLLGEVDNKIEHRQRLRELEMRKLRAQVKAAETKVRRVSPESDEL